MKVNKIFSFLTLIFLGSNIYAQQSDPVAVRINKVPILKSTLEKAFKERAMEDESFYSFLESYIDLKLNLEEAKTQRLDTTANYRRSYSTFKIQLSEKYTQDTTTQKQVTDLFYKRMQEDVEINHVFIPFDKVPLFPSDTVLTYKQALNIKTELDKKGFADKTKYRDVAQAMDVVSDFGSESGYLGWLAPFTMPIEVEDMMYSLNLKEISRPIKSTKGYHIVQVLNKRSAVGAIKIEQVTLSYSELPAAKNEIDSIGKIAQNIYKELLSDPSGFNNLCDEYNRANDRNTGDCGFGEYTLGAALPPVFLSEAFKLEKTGDFTRPIQTDFGYHFVRLTKRVPNPPLDDIRAELADKIMKGNRSATYTRIAHKRLFDTYKLSVNQEAFGQLLDMAQTTDPIDSVYIGKIKNSKDELFSINNDISYELRDFATHLESKRIAAQLNQSALVSGALIPVVSYTISTESLQNMFNVYAARAIGAYADSTLETRIPEFKDLMDLYMNGTLLYEVKKLNVWNKAKTNTAELEKHFNQNRSKYNIWENKKSKGAIFYCKDEDTANAIEKITSKDKKNMEATASKIDKQYNSNTRMVIVEQKIWDENETPTTDIAKKRYKGYPYVVIATREISKPETYMDVRGEVEADYQADLEKKWKESLRKKYTVDIDNSEINTIK